jgi:hypothetical protein
MAFALTGVKAYARDPESSLRTGFVQYLEMTFTAANTDTALALATVAGAAADDDHKKAVLAVIQKAAMPLSSFVLESARAGAAATTVHTLAFSSNNPTFTFAGGGTTPTALTVVLQYRLKDDEAPVVL